MLSTRTAEPGRSLPAPAEGFLEIFPARPECYSPSCRQKAEWVVPKGSTRRNDDIDLPFCMSCLENFVQNAREQDGSFAAELLKRTIQPVPLGKSNVLSRDPDALLSELIVLFQQAGNSIEHSVNLARQAVREMGGSA